jgi:hypothetical protein
VEVFDFGAHGDVFLRSNSTHTAKKVKKIRKKVVVGEEKDQFCDNCGDKLTAAYQAHKCGGQWPKQAAM